MGKIIYLHNYDICGTKLAKETWEKLANEKWVE